jgi:hypothetical protein
MGKTVRWSIVLISGAVLIAVLIAVFVVYRLNYDRVEGYFSPILDADGETVYFVRRRTEGITWGLGYEHFTPPAHAYVVSDALSLRRLDIASGAVTVVKSWPEAPTAGRHLRAYRGRIFQTIQTRLRFAENGKLEYKVRMRINRIPTAEGHSVSAVWNNARNKMEEKDRWHTGVLTISGLEHDRLRGSREVMAVPGREMYGAGIVLRDHEARSTRVLLATGDFRALYPDGVPDAVIEKHSARARIERIRTLKRTRAELIARFRAMGLPEGEALLRTSKEMQRLGFYPKSPTITARTLDEAGSPTGADDKAPLFTIAEAEMRSGIFPDIEHAIENLGKAVDKSMGNYVRHHDYANSARLNELLRSGARKFRVEFRGRLFELTIERP